MCSGSGRLEEPEMEDGNRGNDMEKKKLRTKTTFVRTPLEVKWSNESRTHKCSFREYLGFYIKSVSSSPAQRRNSCLLLFPTSQNVWLVVGIGQIIGNGGHQIGNLFMHIDFCLWVRASNSIVPDYWRTNVLYCTTNLETFLIKVKNKDAPWRGWGHHFSSVRGMTQDTGTKYYTHVNEDIGSQVKPRYFWR